jgi:hypothetical protein
MRILIRFLKFIAAFFFNEYANAKRGTNWHSAIRKHLRQIFCSEQIKDVDADDDRVGGNYRYGIIKQNAIQHKKRAADGVDNSQTIDVLHQERQKNTERSYVTDQFCDRYMHVVYLKFRI